ncbi:hypothetical protein B0H67DRAFT_575948, partial [Lasiosphaeris hirsuta]
MQRFPVSLSPHRRPAPLEVPPAEAGCSTSSAWYLCYVPHLRMEGPDIEGQQHVKRFRRHPPPQIPLTARLPPPPRVSKTLGRERPKGSPLCGCGVRTEFVPQLLSALDSPALLAPGP